MASIAIAHRQQAKAPVPVRVNGVEIGRDAIGKEAQNHPAASAAEAREAAARALVIRELLLQEARRCALEPMPLTDAAGRRETEEEALVRQLIDREVVTPRADEATCRRYFEQNRRRFMSPALHEVAHILLPHGDAPEEAERRATALLAALRDDPAAFEGLARLHSACPSGEVGGSLGQIGPGQTVPEFEAALPELPVGMVAPVPVRTRFGLHIVRLTRRIEARDLPFEIVSERIAAFLEDRVRRTAIHQYIALLAGKAEITGVEIAASRAPLVQ